jgi:hypothetical protein
LRRLTSPYSEQQFEAACLVNGVLISHAGAHPAYFHSTNSQEALEQIQDIWLNYLTRSSLNSSLFALDKYRSPHSANAGGLFWQDFTGLVANHGQYPQLVGHTPLGGPETSTDELVNCIDTGGARTGIAVITGEGKIHYGSDRLE